MAELALDALVQVFGSAVRRHLRAVATTAWSRDPDILGGYSCALAGQAHLRPRLAEPLGERLFFAGEACSLHAYGTVHGAAETGIAAAAAVARTLRGARAAR
jgi:monoamine oxidase